MVLKQAKTRIVVFITIFSDNPQFRKTGNNTRKGDFSTPPFISNFASEIKALWQKR